MKRIISFLAATMVAMSGITVFADFLKDDVLEIKEAVEIIKNDEEVDWSVVDEKNIVEFKLVELSRKHGATITEYWFFIPTTHGNYIMAGFSGNKNKYNGTTSGEIMDDFVEKNGALQEYSVETAKKYAKANGLSEPERINCYMFLHGECPIYGYDVFCDGKEYIIMFYMPEYPNARNEYGVYNFLDKEDCALEIGKAYTTEEFAERFFLESDYYMEYIAEEEAKEQKNSHYIYKNDDLEDVEHFPENEKKEEVKEENKKEEIKQEEKEDKKTEEKEPEESKEEKNEQKDPQKNDEEPVFKKTSYIDVPESHWAYNDITELTGYAIILGYGNGYFGVDDSVTYEQLALLLNRQFGYTSRFSGEKTAKRKDVFTEIVRAMGAELSKADEKVLNGFSDIEALTETEKEYIAYAVQNKLVFGFDGKLCPEDNVTRAETAALLRRAMDFCGETKTEIVTEEATPTTKAALNSGASSQLISWPVAENYGYWNIRVDSTATDYMTVRIHKGSPAGEIVFSDRVAPKQEIAFYCDEDSPLADGSYYISVSTNGETNLGGNLYYKFATTYNELFGRK